MESERIVDAEERLTLIDGQRQRTERALMPSAALLYGVWGAAYLVAYLGLWLVRDSESGSARFVTGYVVYGACLVAALVVTALHVGRRVAGVRGESATAGRRSFLTWIAAFGGYGALMGQLGVADVPDDVRRLVASLLPPLLVGVIYMATASSEGDLLLFRTGLWLAAAAGVAALAGSPAHLLVMAVLGGGGLLVTAAVALVSARRSA
jgi:hypothetical protein